jgi:hypothetical protein
MTENENVLGEPIKEVEEIIGETSSDSSIVLDYNGKVISETTEQCDCGCGCHESKSECDCGCECDCGSAGISGHSGAVTYQANNVSKFGIKVNDILDLGDGRLLRVRKITNKDYVLRPVSRK